MSDIIRHLKHSMMFNKIQNVLNSGVKWFFHHLGFMIEKVPDENKLYCQLSHTHEAVQKYVLKRLTNNIRIANNHKRYNNLLKRYVPEWDSNLTTATFIGNGIGEYSFDSFRKVSFEENCYFEKIYFNDSYDLFRIEWFQKHIYPLLTNSINVAKICKVIKGDLITIVYFEFTHLVGLPGSKLESVSFEISRKLIGISKSSFVKKIAEYAPNYLKDYTLHAFYKGNINRAAKLIIMLSDNRLTSERIEQVIGQQRFVLTHGDIQETNVFENNYLIDWDSFGFYPLGFESAYILYQSDFREGEGALTCEDISNKLLANYRTTIQDDQWLGFELTCFYFYFIFSSLRDQPSAIIQQREILARVEQLFLRTELNTSNLLAD